MVDGEPKGYFGTVSNESDSGLRLPHGNVENSGLIGNSSFDENVVVPVDELSYNCNLKQDNMVGGTVVVSGGRVSTADMAYDLENCYNDVENNSLMQEAIHEVNQALSYEQTNWVASGDYDVSGMCYGDENQQEHQMRQV